MGQKVNPKAFRLNTVYTWPSRWFVRPHLYARILRADTQIRKMIAVRYKDASISKVEIERSTNAVTISIFTAKPGLIIGRGGQGAEELKRNIQRRFFQKSDTINIRIQEVSNPATNAMLIVQAVAQDLEKRTPFRRVLRQVLGRVERAGGVEGARILVKGRLNGAEIARAEKVAFGKIPLATLRADIDYARGAARTIYGAIGIKVWVYKGEKFEKGS